MKTQRWLYDAVGVAMCLLLCALMFEYGRDISPY
jgi:hypothetical protein